MVIVKIEFTVHVLMCDDLREEENFSLFRCAQLVVLNTLLVRIFEEVRVTVVVSFAVSELGLNRLRQSEIFKNGCNLFCVGKKFKFVEFFKTVFNIFKCSRCEAIVILRCVKEVSLKVKSQR